MGGLTAILALLRALWPFFSEAIFGRATVRAWLKKNLFSLVWLMFVIAMFGVVLRLSVTIGKDQVQIKSLTTTNTALQQSFTTDEGKLAQYKLHPELVCPKPVVHGKEPKMSGVVSSVYPTPPPTPKPNDQDQAVLNMLKQIQAEEH
jgi:hypothetical protein